MPNGTKVVEMKTRVGVAGEQTYREALKNISRELRVQKVEMDAVTSAYGANQNSVEALSAKQEALTKQQDAHREKVQILSEMLEIAKQEFGENSEEADQYRIKLATAQTALNKCSNEINTTSTALAEAQKATQESVDATDDLGDTVGEAGDALDEYGEAAGETGDSLGELGDSADDASGKNQAFLSVMAGAAKTLGNVVVAGAKLAAKALLEVGKAAANATKEGFELSKEAGKYADDIATLSTQTGVSQSSLQQWTYASNFVDTSVDSIASSMTKLTQTMGNALNGSSEASDKFATLGVSITDVHGRLRSTEDVFWDAIDALGKIENPAERDAAAIALFGESAQKLNPLIAAGREGFEALNAEAERLGTVFSDDEIATMGGFDDAMQRNSQAVTGLKNAIGLALIPAFQPLVNRATEAMGRVNHAIRDGLTPDEMGELTDYLLDEMDGAIEYIISIIEDALSMLTTAVGKLVSSLGSKLPGMVNRLLPAVTQLLQTLVNTLSANAAGIGQAAGQLEFVFISETWYNSSMKEVRAGRKPYPTDLTDSQWEEIEPLYSGMRNRKWSKRELTNAVLYIVKTGCQWRQLPHDFPPYQTVYSFFSRGAKSGLWEKILAHLVEKTRKDAGKSAEPHYALIDSQSVKTVADNEARGIDGGKKQKGANGMPS